MISRIAHKLNRPQLTLKRLFAQQNIKTKTVDIETEAKSLPSFHFGKYSDFMKRLDTVMTEDPKK